MKPIPNRPQEHPSFYPLEGMSDEDIYHWVNYNQYKANRNNLHYSAIELLEYFPTHGALYEKWHQEDIKKSI